MTLYKVLDAEGKSTNGGLAQWSLPSLTADGTWTPGDWMPEITGKLVPCENGYHLAENQQVITWLGPRVFEAEYDGERVDDDNKLVVRRCRLVREVVNWNERTARLFAVWCARDALQLISNPDSRSVTACNVAERFAIGEATERELAAAWDAARDAARGAARAAARAAAWDAARAAAWGAARAAAWAAARTAAWDAARDAAWAAARDAAWDAARGAAWAAQYQRWLELVA